MTTVKRTRPWVRLCTGVLAAGGLALSAFGWAGSIAQAAPVPAPRYHWCPGEKWDPAWGNNDNWDWNQCHDSVGAAAATSTGMGARRSPDVEPHCR
jgi:hypothetical protein